jgi:signal transduction histidine kinase
VGEHARDLEELSASIAHEIRNPITAAKSLVQQMGEDPRAHENVEYAGVALEELDRVERSISHLLRFARDSNVELREMRMVDVVDSALESFRDRIESLGVRVSRSLDNGCEMVGDPEKLRRVVINLFANALDAMAEGHTRAPHIDVQAGENLAGSEVWVRIRDNGPGIEPERMSKIFSPFYTSKDTGTGLGLALSKKVVDAHGGSMAAESSPGNGTEFLLTFPKHPQEARSRS